MSKQHRAVPTSCRSIILHTYESGTSSRSVPMAPCQRVPEPAEADKHGHPRTGKLSWAATTSPWDGLQPYGHPWLNVLPGQAAASAPAVHHQFILGCREILWNVSQRICATEATSQSEPVCTAGHGLLPETRVSHLGMKCPAHCTTAARTVWRHRHTMFNGCPLQDTALWLVRNEYPGPQHDGNLLDRLPNGGDCLSWPIMQ